MSDAPRASVVIPLYNKETTIRRAIDSVLAQGRRDIEIIVVDDGSTDGSALEVERVADERVSLIRQENAGPGRARNVGAASAKAELLAFLDGDDEWLPGFLDEALAALDRHSEAVAYACEYTTGGSDRGGSNKVAFLTPMPALLPPPAAGIGPRPMMVYLNGLHSSSTVVRRSAFAKVGGFYDRDRCLWGEDSYLWGQILFAGPIYWDPAVRIVFHIEDSSLGYAVKYRSRARPLADLVNDIAPGIAPAHRPAFRMLAQAVAMEDAVDLARSGRLGRALDLRRRHHLLHLGSVLGDFRRYAGWVWRLLRR